MKWSTVLFGGSIGMRTGEVQVVPLVEVLMTMSFEEQPARKRQSGQTTESFPGRAAPVEGRYVGVRTPPATPCVMRLAMGVVRVQDCPPLSEPNMKSDPPSEAGTPTMPS